MTIFFEEKSDDPWALEQKKLFFLNSQTQEKVQITAIDENPLTQQEVKAKLYQITINNLCIVLDTRLEEGKTVSKELSFFQSLNAGKTWNTLERAIPLSEEYLIQSI